MKTREEFVEAVAVYRLQARQYALIFLLAMVVFFVLSILLLAVLAHFLGKHSPLWALWFVVFFWGSFGFNRWQIRHAKQLAFACGLVCPECLGEASARDLKLITATHNCPYCGKQFFS